MFARGESDRKFEPCKAALRHKARWLHGPWQAAQRNAADRGRAPLLVLNIKGVPIDDTTVIVRLADLEQLLKGDTE